MDGMARAVELAERGLGRTAPNPPVGAVVIADASIVGEGYHTAAGRPHAESVALDEAGERALGSTLYVTLEPCAHHGRTPPCADAIVAAGVGEVRYAVEDPDPRVRGRGRKRLEAAGIRVVAGDGSAAAARTLRGYLKRQATGLPWITAKYAMSLDGKIAARTGDARWISGDASRRYAHELRDRVDAVVVGVGTVRTDDPRLTVRPAPPDGRQPLRVVVDTRLSIPLDAALVGPELAAGTLVAFGSDRAARAPGSTERQRTLEERGVSLVPVPEDPDGRVDLSALVSELGRRGLSEVLVEGGGELLASFFGKALVDEVECCVAPIVIGGRGAPTPAAGRGVDRVADAGTWEIVDLLQRPPDVWLRARPRGHPGRTADV